jgi:hypothetical protein
VSEKVGPGLVSEGGGRAGEREGGARAGEREQVGPGVVRFDHMFWDRLAAGGAARRGEGGGELEVEGGVGAEEMAIRGADGE